ncbi:DUF1090 domain-containing protein, partial [Escherichia coli]|nr:DUF1090 domain-containing protein [Escherichia coli]
EVAERQQDLAEAKQKGDADKIAKRERKLAEAQEELKNALTASLLTKKCAKVTFTTLSVSLLI